jgi:outer membrane protein assembly factor BamA
MYFNHHTVNLSQLIRCPIIFAVGMSLMAAAYSSDRPKIVIDTVELKGSLLPEDVQKHLVTSLEQHEYEEGSDWVKDLEDTVVRAEREGWPNRENQGYVGFSVSAAWKPLRREAGILHVLVTVCVNEGQPKRLKAIEFRYVGDALEKPVFGSDDLRGLIPLSDGEIYSRDKFYAGLHAVARAFNDHGFIDFTSKVEMQFDPTNQTVAILVELNEGHPYRWGSIQVVGFDPKVETLLRSKLKAGGLVNPKLIEDFYRDNKSLLPVGASSQSVKWQHDAERATVDLTFDFRIPVSP